MQRSDAVRAMLLVIVSAWLFTSVAAACNNNGICDFQTESCLDCPSDCSCNFEGVKIEQWPCIPSNVGAGSCTNVKTTSGANFDYYDTGAGALTARMTGYLRVKEGEKTFKLVASNVGARVTINSEIIIDSYFQQPVISSSRRVTLRSDMIHTIKVEFYSQGNTKKLSLFWKDSNDYTAPFVAVDSVFFSNNICGDGIPNSNNASSPCVERISVAPTTYSCGDGICMDPLPENCFTDCYSQLSDVCPPIAVPPGSLTDLPVASDTLGALVKNQYYWHLPGIEHMSFGVDVVSGEELLAPLFYFGYCDAQNLQLMQDSYRGATYTIPEQLNAQPSPKCQFSIDSASHTSAVSMADSYAKKAGIDLSANGNVRWGKTSITASAAYSKEESVKKAKELSSTKSGSLIVTEVTCETSKVQLNKVNFHPSFLKDLANATTTNDFFKLVKKYGTHYYKRATLGGRLRQVTTLDSSYEQSASSSEISSNVEKAFSASVSAPVFSADGDYSSSLDQTHDSNSQQSFEKNSFRSTVITYGGPPGSFGPTSSDAPSTFGDWASNIDLLPVPIDYQLESIASIIPEQWKIKNGTTVQAMWAAGETLYRSSVDDLTADGARNMYRYTLLWTFDPLYVFANNYPAAESVYYYVVLDGEKIPITVSYDEDSTNAAPLLMVQSGPNKTPRTVVFHFFSTKRLTTASTFYVVDEGGSRYQWTNDQQVTFSSTKVYGSYIRIVDWTTPSAWTADCTTSELNSATSYMEPVWKYRVGDGAGTVYVLFRLKHVSGPLVSSTSFRLQLVDSRNTIYSYTQSWSELPSENFTMQSVRLNLWYGETPSPQLPFTEIRVQMPGDRRLAQTTYELSNMYIVLMNSRASASVFTTYASTFKTEFQNKTPRYTSIPLMPAKV